MKNLLKLFSIIVCIGSNTYSMSGRREINAHNFFTLWRRYDEDRQAGRPCTKTFRDIKATLRLLAGCQARMVNWDERDSDSQTLLHHLIFFNRYRCNLITIFFKGLWIQCRERMIEEREGTKAYCSPYDDSDEVVKKYMADYLNSREGYYTPLEVFVEYLKQDEDYSPEREREAYEIADMFLRNGATAKGIASKEVAEIADRYPYVAQLIRKNKDQEITEISDRLNNIFFRFPAHQEVQLKKKPKELRGMPEVEQLERLWFDVWTAFCDKEAVAHDDAAATTTTTTR